MLTYHNICNYIDEISDSFINKISEETYFQLDNETLKLAEDREISFDDFLLKVNAAVISTETILQDNYVEEITNLYKKTVWAVLRYVIKPQYFWDVDIKTEEYPQFIHLKAGDLESKKVLEQAIVVEEENADRAHEIKQLKKSLGTKFDGIILISMARIKIYDSTMPPSKRLVTDIDGLVMKVNKEKLIIEFHEAKNKRNAFNVARKDLNDKFIKILNKKRISYRIKEVRSMGAKLVITFNN